LASGLLLGTRGGFDSEIKKEFISTGTIHIIALSGYNITIVAEGVMKILGLVLAQTFSVAIGVVVIFLFIIMAGASSTAIRAGIMASVALFARITGRTYEAGRALVVAALMMIAYDLRVVTDISFQLSFIATFGVLFVAPKIIKLVVFIPASLGLRELVATTIGATIAVLPILLYSTGILSIVSLPTNILILPFIPIAMFFIFISGILAFISIPVSIPFAYLSQLILKYILATIHFFAELPFASVTVSTFPLVLTIVLYLLILWWVFKKKAPSI
jgi:competence protein ComEC